MTVQEAIVEFLHGWIDTGRTDLPAFVEAAHKYFCETVIDGTPASKSKSDTGTGTSHSHPTQQVPGQGASKK